jgi:hypothetical protein
MRLEKIIPSLVIFIYAQGLSIEKNHNVLTNFQCMKKYVANKSWLIFFKW